MIFVALNLFVTLTKYHPSPGTNVRIALGTTVAEMIQMLHIPDNGVKLMFINGRKVHPDTELRDGDRLGVFPPVGGG